VHRIGRAQHVEQRFLDAVLAEEQDAIALRQTQRERRLAAAW